MRGAFLLFYHHIFGFLLLYNKSLKARERALFMIFSLQILNMVYKVLRDNTFIGRSRVVYRATKL